MPTRDFRDYQCYVIVGNMRQPAKLVKLEAVAIEEGEISYPPRKLLTFSGAMEYAFTLTEESTRQMIAIAHGYPNYNCMQRDIRRQKRKLKEMRKRAKKEKYGTAKAD